MTLTLVVARILREGQSCLTTSLKVALKFSVLVSGCISALRTFNFVKPGQLLVTACVLLCASSSLAQMGRVAWDYQSVPVAIQVRGEIPLRPCENYQERGVLCSRGAIDSVSEGDVFHMTEIGSEGGCTIDLRGQEFEISSCPWVEGFSDPQEDLFAIVSLQDLRFSEYREGAYYSEPFSYPSTIPLEAIRAILSDVEVLSRYQVHSISYRFNPDTSRDDTDWLEVRTCESGIRQPFLCGGGSTYTFEKVDGEWKLLSDWIGAWIH